MSYQIGQVVTGRVSGLQPYGAFVSLSDEIQGLIHVSEIQAGYTKNIQNVLNVGDKIRVQIIDIDEYSGKISLSIRTLENKVHTIPFRKKRYFTNKNIKIGFADIETQLPIWIEESVHFLKNREG